MTQYRNKNSMRHLHIYDVKSGNVTEKEIETTSIVPAATIIKTASSTILNSQVTEKDDVHPASGTSIYLCQYLSFLVVIIVLLIPSITLSDVIINYILSL